MLSNNFSSQYVLSWSVLTLTTALLLASDEQLQQGSADTSAGIEAQYHTKVYGNVENLAYYYIYVNVGTPPQTQTLIIDSGSSILSFSCSDCKDCGHHISKKFDHSLSSTSQWTPYQPIGCHPNNKEWCTYIINYVEKSSLQGNFLTDFLAFGDDEAHTPVFNSTKIGCHNVETNLFSDQMVSGILGIGCTSHKSCTLDNLLGPLEDEKKMFGLCLAKEGGIFLMGGYTHPSIPPTKMKWIPIIGTDELKIQLEKFSLDNNSTIPAKFATVVDSGTTHSYFPKSLHTEIKNKLNEVLPIDISVKNCPICYDSKYFEELINILPTFKLVFEDGVVIEWEPISYLSNRIDINAVEVGIGVSMTDKITLGMTFFKYHNVVFDIHENLIGIGNTDCPTATDTTTEKVLTMDWFIYNNNSIQSTKVETTPEIEVEDIPSEVVESQNVTTTTSKESLTLAPLIYNKYLNWVYIVGIGAIVISIIVLFYTLIFKSRRGAGYSTIADQHDESWGLQFDNEAVALEMSQLNDDSIAEKI